MTMTLTGLKKRGRPRKEKVELDTSTIRLDRANLHVRAFHQLRGMIVQGALAPGMNLVETDLCERLGVSRTPLREALKLLAAEGLVELRQNRTARITSMRKDEAVDLFEALGTIERCAAEFAALRMTSAQLEALSDMQTKMESHYAAGRLEDYFVVNHAIHGFIVAGANNKALAGTHQWLLARAERARFFALKTRTRWIESIEEHRGILAALTERDAVKAGQLLATHVFHTGEQMALYFANADEAAAA